MNTKKQDLRAYLESNLLAITFNNLHTILEVSRNRITYTLNNPTKANAKEVKMLSKISKVTPNKLVNLTDCGIHVLTLADAKNLGIKYSNKIN